MGSLLRAITIALCITALRGGAAIDELGEAWITEPKSGSVVEGPVVDVEIGLRRGSATAGATSACISAARVVDGDPLPGDDRWPSAECSDVSLPSVHDDARPLVARVALLKRPAASAGAGGSAAAKKVSKTSKILQSLVRARDGTSQHEMLGKWTDAKAAQFKEKDRTPAERRAAAADELDRDAPELSAGLDGTEESKGGEAPATSDDDEPATALVDADADSDDDDAMEIRARDAAAAKSAKKAKAKAKEAKKENGRKPKDADVKKKKQADKLAKILGMSHA